MNSKRNYKDSLFVQYVIFYKKSGEENYVAKALKRCEDEGLLPDYFSELEKEEQTMIFGEYSYEDDIRVQRLRAELAAFKAKL